MRTALQKPLMLLSGDNCLKALHSQIGINLGKFVLTLLNCFPYTSETKSFDNLAKKYSFVILDPKFSLSWFRLQTTGI